MGRRCRFGSSDWLVDAISEICRRQKQFFWGQNLRFYSKFGDCPEQLAIVCKFFQACPELVEGLVS